MKFLKYQLLVLIAVMMFVFVTSCIGQRLPHDKDIYHKLMSMDFKEYEDKPVELFLKNIGYRYERYIPSSRKPGYISHVIFRYNDSISVDIAVRDLGQKEPLNFNYKFDIKEFSSKKTDWICFRYGGRCIKGCDERDCE
jgi:hypothetical protein